MVSYSAYNNALISLNILVKAKNFLVFQGDVEAVASQSPKELSRLIEQISGSLELASEYDAALAAQERATENATFNFTKRRGIAGEIKQYKEQKGEVERFEALCQERVRTLQLSCNTDVAYNHLHRTSSFSLVSYTSCTTYRTPLRSMPRPFGSRTNNLSAFDQSNMIAMRRLKLLGLIRREPEQLSCGKRNVSNERRRL